MIKKIIKKISSFIDKMRSLEKQARKAGCQIGENNFIASHFWSSEAFLIKIGNNCQITDDVKFFTHGGGNVARVKYPKFDCFGKVVIGDYVYIGTGAFVMPGVTVGNNVLIAAGSVVTKSIPDNCVVAGNPAKFICTLDEYIERNLPFNLDSKGLSLSMKKRLLLSVDQSKFIRKKKITIDDKLGN